MQISSLSANVSTSNLRFFNKLTSNGNVNAGSGYIVEVDRSVLDIDTRYFNKFYGPYSTVDPSVTGVISETMTPYVDANNNGRFDASTECLGIPAVLVYVVSPPINTPNGLIAYYTFDGNATDASGNNNNGTIQGVTLVPDRRGMPAGAYRFSAGAKIIVSNSSSLTLNDAYTFSGWFNLRSFEGRSSSTGVISVTDGVQTIFSKNCEPGRLYAGMLPAPDGPPRMNIGGGVLPNYLSTSTRVSLDTWMHVAQTYEQGETSLYLNGNLVARGGLSINLSASNQSSLIIGGTSCSSDFFNGDLDDLRFYNRSLSYQEIKSIFIAENGPIQSVKTGSWLDPGTWSCNCIPTSANPVEVKHVVNIPDAQTGSALSVRYGVGGRVDLGASAKLQLVDN